MGNFLFYPFVGRQPATQLTEDLRPDLFGHRLSLDASNSR